MYAVGQFFCIKNLQNHEKSKIELPFFFSISIELITYFTCSGPLSQNSSILQNVNCLHEQKPANKIQIEFVEKYCILQVILMLKVKYCRFRLILLLFSNVSLPTLYISLEKLQKCTSRRFKTVLRNQYKSGFCLQLYCRFIHYISSSLIPNTYI